ncbi:MAG: IS200/IS605 family transposase [bacterium]
MSHTYSSIFFHIVWSTKNRLPKITDVFKEKLYGYIGGIIKNERCELLVIGGMSDHIHILVRIPAQYSVANLVCKIKSNSSKFINQSHSQMKFLWQAGYGVFSVSLSKVNVVKNYIINQEIHLKKYSFMDEFLKLLNKHEIEHDKKYLFK